MQELRYSNRNHGIHCLAHLVATEFLSVKKSKGDILLFRKNTRSVAGRCHDEEVRAAQKPLGASSQRPFPLNRRSRLNYVNDFAEEDVAASWRPNPPTLLWNDLTYDIQLKKNTRRLLNDLEGWVMPGMTTALMVSSRGEGLGVL